MAGIGVKTFGGPTVRLPSTGGAMPAGGKPSPGGSPARSRAGAAVHLARYASAWLNMPTTVSCCGWSSILKITR